MDHSQIETVIIGAGISGISAAVHLLKNGYEDFCIYEAGDRIGGRCHTIPHENGIIEYGAQFIHGQVDNPIYKIAIENDLIDECYSQILYESDEDLSKHNGLKINLDDKECLQLFLNEKGDSLDENLVEIAFDCLNKSIRTAENFGCTRKVDQDQQLGSFLYKKYLDLVKKYLNIDDEPTRKILDGLFLWRCKWENVENGCSSVSEMSLNNFCQFNELKGSQIMEPKRGYKSIIDTILEDHACKFNERLNLGHELTKVLICENLDDNCPECKHCLYTSDRSKVVLFLSDKVVVCKNLILTVSLGYLKENVKSLIEPLRYLTDQKLSAISRMGYGTVNKIILEYEKPFWQDNLEGINLIWSNSENVFNELDHINFDHKKRWFEDVCSFEPAVKFDNILLGWIGGNVYHEGLSDQEVINECTKNLRKFFKNENIPEPKNVFRSKWNSNKFFKGSYSFYAYGSHSEDIEILAEPIEIDEGPLIMFAGEATHSEFYSTVHGAYLTGIREAERILQI